MAPPPLWILECLRPKQDQPRGRRGTPHLPHPHPGAGFRGPGPSDSPRTVTEQSTASEGLQGSAGGAEAGTPPPANPRSGKQAAAAPGASCKPGAALHHGSPELPARRLCPRSGELARCPPPRAPGRQRRPGFLWRPLGLRWDLSSRREAPPWPPRTCTSVSPSGQSGQRRESVPPSRGKQRCAPSPGRGAAPGAACGSELGSGVQRGLAELRVPDAVSAPERRRRRSPSGAEEGWLCGIVAPAAPGRNTYTLGKMKT